MGYLDVFRAIRVAGMLMYMAGRPCSVHVSRTGRAEHGRSHRTSHWEGECQQDQEPNAKGVHNSYFSMGRKAEFLCSRAVFPSSSILDLAPVGRSSDCPRINLLTLP